MFTDFWNLSPTLSTDPDSTCGYALDDEWAWCGLGPEYPISPGVNFMHLQGGAYAHYANINSYLNGDPLWKKFNSLPVYGIPVMTQFGP
jgi:hypothetical protein